MIWSLHLAQAGLPNFPHLSELFTPGLSTFQPANLPTCKPSSSRHGDEIPISATPLECAFTKRDARNPFRFRSYENCRVVLVRLTKNLHLSDFARPFSSITYELPNSQALCFDGLANCRG
jgi:hypothetical protein